MKEKVLFDSDSIGFNIELIQWMDSFGCTSTWSAINQIDTCLICNSVGFVVSETDKTISLANSIAKETTDTVEQANGVMTIPKACIISRTKF